MRHLLAIILMIKKPNTEIVAELMDMDADNIQHWVELFNEGGLEALYKKNLRKTTFDFPIRTICDKAGYFNATASNWL